jgi:hypothetical protein
MRKDNIGQRPPASGRAGLAPSAVHASQEQASRGLRHPRKRRDGKRNQKPARSSN